MIKKTPNTKTVLVISDGPEQFALTASLLEKDGYDVLFERDMRHSLDFVKARPPQIIISELAVHNVDGLELCRRLGQEKTLGPTPVVLVGDLSRQSSIVADGLRCGAADYLQKPVDQVELFDLCRSVVAAKGPVETFDRDDDLFQSLIENISDVITIIDADDKTILFESPSANRIFGYERGELLGKRTVELVHPADANEVVEYLNAVHWSAGIFQPVDYRFRQKDGSWKLIESVARPIDDPRFGSAVIITSREKPREEFSLDGALDNETVRRAMFDNAATGMAVMSPSGHVTKANRALLRMLDHSADELRDMSLAELIFPADAENDKRALVEIICGKRWQHQFENGYLLPDGGRIWGRVTIVAIPGCTGGAQTLMAIFEDPYRDPAQADIGDGRLQGGNADLARWKIDTGLISKN